MDRVFCVQDFEQKANFEAEILDHLEWDRGLSLHHICQDSLI